MVYLIRYMKVTKSPGNRKEFHLMAHSMGCELVCAAVDPCLEVVVRRLYIQVAQKGLHCNF